MNLSDYRAIRASGKELGSKIFKYAVDNNKQDLVSTAKLLGLWNGKMFIFESENDSNALMDFMVFEKPGQNSPAFKRFHLCNPGLNDAQLEHIDGMYHNFSSLFEVKSIDRMGNTLVLTDLLDNDRKEYLLMDIGLSKTAPVGFVLFTRLIPIRDINMTSGSTFGFKSMYKDKVLSAISLATFQKRRKLNSNEIYILMHNKNRQFGMETRTE